MERHATRYRADHQADQARPWRAEAGALVGGGAVPAGGGGRDAPRVFRSRRSDGARWLEPRDVGEREAEQRSILASATDECGNQPPVWAARASADFPFVCVAGSAGTDNARV